MDLSALWSVHSLKDEHIYKWNCSKLLSTYSHVLCLINCLICKKKSKSSSNSYSKSLFTSTWGETAVFQGHLHPKARLFDVGPGPDSIHFPRALKLPIASFTRTCQAAFLHFYPHVWEPFKLCNAIIWAIIKPSVRLVMDTTVWDGS